MVALNRITRCVHTQTTKPTTKHTCSRTTCCNKTHVRVHMNVYIPTKQQFNARTLSLKICECGTLISSNMMIIIMTIMMTMRCAMFALVWNVWVRNIVRWWWCCCLKMETMLICKCSHLKCNSIVDTLHSHPNVYFKYIFFYWRFLWKVIEFSAFSIIQIRFIFVILIIPVRRPVRENNSKMRFR